MSKGHCITTILGCIVVYFLLIAFCLSQSPHPAVADDPTLKGKGKDDACIDYASALSSRLAANGVHGQLIFYRWHIHNTTIDGSHVFVLYRLPDDSEWIVDNEIPHPRQVAREASPTQLVFLLSGAQSAPVDVELQDSLNHLTYF
jgi:hypothetical protein